VEAWENTFRLWKEKGALLFERKSASRQKEGGGGVCFYLVGRGKKKGRVAARERNHAAAPEEGDFDSSGKRGDLHYDREEKGSFQEGEDSSLKGSDSKQVSRLVIGSVGERKEELLTPGRGKKGSPKRGRQNAGEHVY